MYTKVNELRWFLFSNRGSEGEHLPPTTGSLKLHIQRAHYVAMIWRKADECHPSLPSSVQYGWQLLSSDGTYIPVLCSNPPTPEAVMHLVTCSCRKGCTGGRCSPYSNNIPCTEVCGCVEFTCNNQANTVTELVVGLEDED